MRKPEVWWAVYDVEGISDLAPDREEAINKTREWSQMTWKALKEAGFTVRKVIIKEKAR